MSLEEMINFEDKGEKPGDIVMARVSDGLGLKTEMKGRIIKRKPKTRYEDEWSLWRVELLEDYPDYLWGPEKGDRFDFIKSNSSAGYCGPGRKDCGVYKVLKKAKGQMKLAL